MNPLILLMLVVPLLMAVAPILVFYCIELRLPWLVFNVLWRCPVILKEDIMEAVVTLRQFRRSSYKIGKFMLLLTSFIFSEMVEQEITSRLYSEAATPLWVSILIAGVCGILVYYIFAALMRLSLSDLKDEWRMVVVIRTLKNQDYDYLREYLSRHVTRGEFDGFARFELLSDKARNQLDGGRAEFDRLMLQIPSDFFKA